MRMNDGITRLLTLLAGIASAGAYYMYARLSTDRDIHIAVSGLLILLPLPFYQSIQKLSPFYHTTMSYDPGGSAPDTRGARRNAFASKWLLRYL